jgi:hypothetical protein
MMVRTFAVLMKKSPSVVSIISAFLITKVDVDGDAEDDKNKSQEVLN